MKNIFRICLTLLAIFTVTFTISELSITANAEAFSGTCGTNVNWSLDTETGVLSITGTGRMSNYSYNSSAPWYSYLSNIKSVAISDGITSIGAWTFYGCSSLTSINIPDGVTSIGEGAFYNCSSLTNIAIPDGVTSIGSYAFGDCRSLTSIAISNGVTSIGIYAFYGCTSLASVTIPVDNKYDYTLFSSCPIEEICFTYGKTGVMANLDSSNYTKTLVGAHSSTLKQVTLEQGITNVGSYAFYSCNSLTSVIIPDGVTYIGYNAFYRCSSLTSITIPVDNKYDYTLFSSCPIEEICFTYGKTGVMANLDSSNYTKTLIYTLRSTLKQVTLEQGITNVGSYAFYSCNSLTSVTIPDGVTSIGNYAFYGCSRLTSINIPNSVTSIGSYAFQGCSSLTSVTIPDGVTSIGYRTFYGCSSLTSINIPDGVTSISSDAFYGCSSLTSITIPVDNAFSTNLFSNCPIEEICFTYGKTGVMANLGSSNYTNTLIYTLRSTLKQVTLEQGITNVGSYAFYSCNSLTSITIPDSVTSIGDWAFYGCDNLTNITIPNSVTSIGEYAFEYCSSLTSVTIGNSVTSIGSNAFSVCSSLTSIAIPDSVTSIGSYAFQGCSSLTSINIPDSVTSIGSYAFYGCSSLTSIDIPNSVTSIGNSAFYSCTSLTSIKIPDGVTSIGSYAFGGCTSLTSVTIPVDNKYDYTLFSDCPIEEICFTYGKTGVMANLNSSNYTNTLIYAHRSTLKQVTLEQGITNVGSYAFYSCNSLTSVTIPDSVTSIGYRTFYGCSSLTSINIPDGVTSISSDAFYGCTSLTSINVAATNEHYSSVDGVLFNKDMSLLIHYPANKSATYVIPDSVTSIGDRAFYGCKSLTSVTIPDSVTSIGSYAFYYCSSLKTITLPIDVSYDTDDSFYGCDSVETIYYTPGKTGIATADTSDWFYQSRRSLKSVVFADGITSIDQVSFFNCTSLTSVTIPGSVTPTGYDSKFSGCSSLSTINCEKNINQFLAFNIDLSSLSENLEVTCTDGKVLTIDGVIYAVYLNSHCSVIDAKNINELTILNEIDNIPVTSIGERAFYGCSSLTSINIPDSVTSIGSNAFSVCSSLTSIAIPNSVTSIGNSAFSGCTELTTLEIPGKVASIGNYAFNNCKKLSSITYHGRVEKFKAVIDNSYSSIDEISNAVINCDDADIHIINYNIYWPNSDGSAYSLVHGSGAESIITDNINGIPVTSIGYGAFSSCSSLTSVTIGNSVTSIGNSAFYNCSSLTSITIPDSVTSIGYGAFYNCSSLTNVTIPNGVTSIGSYAFYGCTSLTSVTIGNSVTSIGSYAFSGCKSLTNITIPDSVTSIGSNAFYNCINLESVTIPSGVKAIGSDAFGNCLSLTDITFLGHAPGIQYYYGTVFNGVVATAYYPKASNTYTDQVKQSYGGTITWVAADIELPDISGDLNGDSAVTVDDALYILWHTFMPNKYPLSQACDYNGDGSVTVDDALYILWHTFMPNKYPL